MPCPIAIVLGHVGNIWLMSETQDGIAAYKVGHSVALQAAIEAVDEWDLLHKAYLYEGIAQHSLSDSFSSGHVRVPRRALHSDPRRFGFLTNQAPGDKCNQYMHDEDSATGLWMSNARGDSWPVYGDKQYLTWKNLPNQEQAYYAMQAGLDEILQAYKSKTAPAEHDYAALQRVPRASKLDEHQNFVPLFRATTNATSIDLSVRQDLRARNNETVSAYSVDRASDNENFWQGIRNGITNSGIIANMYPRTMNELTPEANITQLRQLNSTHFIVNHYGPVWTRLFQSWPGQTARRSWNMVSQTIAPVATNGSVTWEWIGRVEKGVYALIGSQEGKSIHLGLEDGYERSGKSGLDVLWSFASPEPRICSKGTYTYGIRSSGASMPALVKLCDGPDPVFELWTQSAATSAPTLSTTWSVLPATNLSNFVLSSQKSASYLVDVAFDSSSKSYAWNFTSWSDGFKTRTSETLTEQAVGSAAQAFLVGQLFKDARNESIVRIFTTPATARIDVIDYTPSQPIKPSSQTFDFDSSFCEGIEWFLADVNDDTKLDVVAYCSSSDATLTTAVFLNRGKGGSSQFDEPRISTILPNVPKLFNAPFLKSVVTITTQVFDTDTQLPSRNKAGLLQLFDNYGILGVRLLKPVSDDLALYTPVGQTPAIAGQVSDALGPDGLGFMFH